MNRHILIKGYLFAVISCLLWSTNFVVARAIRDIVGPFTITSIRTALAVAILLPFVRAHGGLGDLRARWRLWLACAVTGVVGTSGFTYWALHFTLAVNAALINGTGPLFTIVLGRAILREPVGPAVLAGFTLSFVGVIWIISGGNPAVLLGLHVNIGDAMLIFVMTLWALYSVLGRKIMAQTPTTMFTGNTLLTALPFVLLMGSVEVASQGPPVLGWPLVGASLYLTLANTVVGFLLWNEAVRLIGPTRVAITYNTVPLFGAILALLFLGEPLAWHHVVGGALIIVGSTAGILATGEQRGEAVEPRAAGVPRN
ncbi:MAG: DMT family transporter [Armatimonadetes bacterium]|nr:DMT family transporter [Armatimonadota bacterium]